MVLINYVAIIFMDLIVSTHFWPSTAKSVEPKCKEKVPFLGGNLPLWRTDTGAWRVRERRHGDLQGVVMFMTMGL